MTDRRNRRKRPIPIEAYYAPVPQASYQAPPPPYPEPVSGARVLADKNATVANVSVVKTTDWAKGPDYEFKASGSSKREQGDRYDPRAGELMALGRAYVRLGRDLLSAGNRRAKEVLAAQAAELKALEEKRNAPKRPVHRRTREEWEEMAMADNLGLTPADGFSTGDKRGVQQMADSLGLTLEESEMAERHMAVARAMPLPEHRHEFRVELSHGRHLAIEDGDVVEYTATGRRVRLTRS